jgi:hypothetical protein
MTGRHLSRRVVVVATLSLAITAFLVEFGPTAAATKSSKTIGFFSATGINSPEPEQNGQEPGLFACTAGQPEIVRSSTAGTPTVDISTTGGSAIAGTDYTAVSMAVVTFKKGQACAPIPLTLFDDEGSSETGETVQFSLSNPSSGYTLSNVSSTTIAIVEDASPPTPSAPTASVPSGSSQVSLTWNTGGTDSSARAVDEFIVERSTTSGSGYQPVPNGTVPGNIQGTASFTDPNVPPGTYYYVVQAVDDGVIAQSQESSAVTVPGP